MPSFRKNAILSIAAAIALAIVAPVSAMAQGACFNYAKISLKQWNDNKAKSCGFIGPQWSDNFDAHKSWCARVPPRIWKQMAKARQQQLDNRCRR